MAFPDLRPSASGQCSGWRLAAEGALPVLWMNPCPWLSSAACSSSVLHLYHFRVHPIMITLRFRRRDRREDVWCLLLWPFYVVYISLLNVLSAVPDRRPLWYIMSTLFLKFFHKAPHWSFMRAGIFVVVFVFFHCYIPPTHLEHRWAHNKNSVHICWLNGHPKLLRVYVSG